LSSEMHSFFAFPKESKSCSRESNAVLIQNRSFNRYYFLSPSYQFIVS
jgi:hypothetical protein